jgi:hypothetical protein
MLRHLARAFVVATFTSGMPLAVANAGAVTIQSDGNTLAASIGQGFPSTAMLQQLDAGNDAGLTYAPALVGGFGSFTPVPAGAPAGTQVINIPPGDGENGFFKVDFTLPSSFANVSLSGAANVDDTGRIFLNGTAITPSLFSGNQIGEFGDTPFSTSDSSLFLPGQNVLLVADGNAGGGPSAAAFYATVAFNASVVPEPTGLTLAGITGLACLVAARRRQQVR